MKVSALDESTFVNLVKFHADGVHVKSRESVHLEFKENFNGNAFSKYMKTMAAFANNGGGYIVFGISDSPRSALGLSEKSLKKFNDLKIEAFDTLLARTFEPHIEWDCGTYEHDGKVFGVIYVPKARQRPIICSTQFGEGKDCLREGDVYFRYTGQSKRIAYPELASIIQEERLREQKRWSDLMSRIATIGASDAALLDLSSGALSGAGGTVVIDEDIMARIAFIKEGEFSEVRGKPTLKLIGEVKSIEAGKLVLGEKRPRSHPQAIDADLIIRDFLGGKPVAGAFEFAKAIASGNTANLPIYYYLSKDGISADDAITYLSNLGSRGQSKEQLLARLKGRTIPYSKEVSSDAYAKKILFKQQWLDGELEVSVEDYRYKVQAIQTMSPEEIIESYDCITAQMLDMYDLAQIAKIGSNSATSLRYAICYIDEVVFRAGVTGGTESA